MASTYLTRTPASAGNLTTWTFSGWFKRLSMGNTTILGCAIDGQNQDLIYFQSDGTLRWWRYGSNNYVGQLKTTRVFRDSSAWYHIVFVWDSSNATADNRMRIYVNGTQETVFTTRLNPPLNTTSLVNTADALAIGRAEADIGTYPYFDGSMAHVHFIDGTAYDASAFGQTDSTTGQWKPKTAPSVTYGTNGFFLKFANSGSMGADSSGNGNNFSVAAGTLTQTQDTPSNVFCSLNNNILTPNGTWANLNTKFTDGDSSHKTTWGTLGFSSGKWYWEAKASNSGTVKHTIGLDNIKNQSNYTMVSLTNLIVGYNPAGGYASGDAIGWYDTTLYKNGSIVASSLSQIANNDIMMLAVDADNGKIYFGKNGTWRVANSSTFDSAQHDTTFTTGETYCPAFSAESCSWLCNFGNGYFGTTAVSSANSDGAGLGLFEYAPPTGYYSLCTKNINTYG